MISWFRKEPKKYVIYYGKIFEGKIKEISPKRKELYKEGVVEFLTRGVTDSFFGDVMYMFPEEIFDNYEEAEKKLFKLKLKGKLDMRDEFLGEDNE